MRIHKHQPMIAIVAILALGCGARLVALPPASGSMITQTGQDPTLVRAAIARALADQRFTVESEEPGKISARLDHRGLQLRLAVTYTERDYQIQYVDSVGLAYQLDPQTGQPMISRKYPRYIARLDQTIRSELDRPAREAAEAAEAEREHQIELAEAETARQVAIERERNREHERERAHMTEQERLRAQAAQASADRERAIADAEYARRMPPPTITGVQPVQVSRMQFEPEEVQQDAVSLSPGFTPDPYIVTGRANGRASSQSLGIPSSCAGFWTRRPQEVLYLPYGMEFLRVDAVANEDVTLAIVTPDGQVWCDDDSAGGTNARLAGGFPAGTYGIYVGTYRAGRVAQYALEMSERAAASGGQQWAAREEQAPAQPPDCRQSVLNAGHSGAHLIHCQGAEPWCAAALIEAGHSPAHLIHCQGVDPSCAVTMMRNGRNPAELIHCR